MADKIIIDKKVIEKAVQKQAILDFAKKMDMTNEYDKILFCKELELSFNEADIYIKGQENLFLAFKKGDYSLGVEGQIEEEPTMYRIIKNVIKFTFIADDGVAHSFYVCNYLEGELKKFSIYIKEKRERADEYMIEMFKRNAYEREIEKRIGVLDEFAFAFLRIFAYIQQKALRKKEKIKKTRSFIVGDTRGQEKKLNQNYTVYLDKRIQYVYEPSNVQREFTRHCEAWNVRGHYRQYKSGKTIFIHPYTKGKGRSNQKQYFI